MEDDLAAKHHEVEELNRELEELRSVFGTEGFQQVNHIFNFLDFLYILSEALVTKIDNMFHFYFPFNQNITR